MSQARQARIVEATAVGLFFIQALRAVVSALFGILYDYGFEGSVNAWSVGAVGLMAVAFLAPLLLPRGHAIFALTGAALFVFAARPVLNVNELMPRYWAGLVVLAAGGVYLAALIRSAPDIVAPSLIAALVLDQVLRALGNTYDLSIRPDLLSTQIAISLALVLLALWVFGKREPPAPSGQLSVTGGLAVSAALFVLTSLLTLPNAMARWSDFEYTAIAPVLIAVTCTPLLPPIRNAARQLQSRRSKAGLLALLLIGLVIGYQRWGIWSALGLLAACMVTLVCLVRAVAPRDEKPDRTGLGLTLGLLLLLALNLALAFSFTYPYTLRFMQGMGLPVYLVAGCVTSLRLRQSLALGVGRHGACHRAKWRGRCDVARGGHRTSLQSGSRRCALSRATAEHAQLLPAHNRAADGHRRALASAHGAGRRAAHHEPTGTDRHRSRSTGRGWTRPARL